MYNIWYTNSVLAFVFLYLFGTTQLNIMLFPVLPLISRRFPAFPRRFSGLFRSSCALPAISQRFPAFFMSDENKSKQAECIPLISCGAFSFSSLRCALFCSRLNANSRDCRKIQPQHLQNKNKNNLPPGASIPFWLTACRPRV